MNFHDCIIDTLTTVLTTEVILRINILWQTYKMQPHSGHTTLNPPVNHLATIFCGFTERWIFRLADSTFVTKIFTIRQTVVITFITAALISITYQLLQVLFELHIRNSLWLILRELTGSLLNEVLLILLFPFPCFVSRSFTFSFFLDVFLFSCCFLEVILSPVSSL